MFLLELTIFSASTISLTMLFLQPPIHPHTINQQMPRLV
jgi:hypothetical protein